MRIFWFAITVSCCLKNKNCDPERLLTAPHNPCHHLRGPPPGAAQNVRQAGKPTCRAEKYKRRKNKDQQGASLDDRVIAPGVPCQRTRSASCASFRGKEAH